MSEWITDLRKVPGFDHYMIDSTGSVFSEARGRKRKLSPSRNRRGYCMIKLSKNGRVFLKLVHRLVLEAFVGPCPDGMQCCHSNGNCSDNRLENLRWDTPKANAADKHLHGTQTSQPGESNGTAKLKESEVYAIRADQRVHHEIALDFGVSRESVTQIKNRKTWGHLP